MHATDRLIVYINDMKSQISILRDTAIFSFQSNQSSPSEYITNPDGVMPEFLQFFRIGLLLGISDFLLEGV